MVPNRNAKINHHTVGLEYRKLEMQFYMKTDTRSFENDSSSQCCLSCLACRQQLLAYLLNVSIVKSLLLYSGRSEEKISDFTAKLTS